METVYFQSTPCHTYGLVPAAGSKAPEFELVSAELQPVTLEQFKSKRVILNVFPSLDTPVCAMSVRRFNKEAAALDDTVVLCVSMDLPFAAGRFCSAEGIKDVIPASAFRSPKFGQEYGLTLIDGPLKGLLARAVIIIDANGGIIYRELVSEITQEPDYDAALSVLKGKY